MRVGALAIVVWFVAAPALANVINVNFCDCSINFPPEALAEYMPLVEALSFPDADVNGASWMDDRESFKCELGGNAMPDCSCELGLVSAILRNPELDFKAVGGVSHEMVYNVFTHNLAVLQAYLGVEDYAALQPLFDPLLALIYGHLTIGNGAFEEEAPGQYTFSGSGGYAISLIYALPTTVPISPETIDLANYSKLPEYLAWNGDADGDGFSNLDEYLASESTAEFVAGALDRTRCGSQVIGEGEGEEGESEGEEGEGEGEEGEGEEDPGEDPPLPAAKGFAIAFLLSVFLGGGILLHSAGTGRNGRRPAN